MLILAGAIGLWSRRESPLPRGIRSFLCAGVALMVVWIYVGGLPLAILQKFPPFGTNAVGRLLSVLGFFLAWLAAVGLHLLGRPRRGAVGLRGWIVGSVLVVGTLVATGFGVRSVLRLAEVAGQRPYALNQIRIALELAGAGAVVVAAAAWRARWSPASWRPAEWAIPPLLAVQILALAFPFWARSPKADFYPVTPAHRFLATHLGEERFASSHLTMYPGTTTVYGLRQVGGHAFPDPAWAQLLRAVDPHALRLPTFPQLGATKADVTSPILDRLAVRYYAVGPGRPFGRGVPVPAADGATPLTVGSTVSVPVARGPIRAVTVRLLRVSSLSSDARLQVVLAEPTAAP